MTSVHYEVEVRYVNLSGNYQDDLDVEPKMYRSPKAALKRAKRIMRDYDWLVEATRVVKVTRETVSRRDIKKGVIK